MIVQERNKTNWMDAYICESKEDAKKYIKKQIQEGKRAEDFRIITNLIECRTEVVFLEKSQPPKIKETKKAKGFSEEELKLAFFRLSCELGRWAKTTDFNDADRSRYPSWMPYRQNFGGITNVTNLVCFELKREELKPEYRALINEYFGKEVSGQQVIEKLTAGGRR